MADITYTALTKVIYGAVDVEYAKQIEALVKHDRETMELLGRTHDIVHASTVTSFMPSTDVLFVFVTLVYRERHKVVIKR